VTRLPWKKGQLSATGQPVLVSATRFTYRSIWTMPGVFWHGLALRRAWPSFEGSIGVSISGDLQKRSTYTISAWRSEADLRKFISHPAHLTVMKNYRSRMESSSTATWTTEHFTLSEAWRRALTTLTGMPLRRDTSMPM
jgi:hypothetical protein